MNVQGTSEHAHGPRPLAGALKSALHPATTFKDGTVKPTPEGKPDSPSPTIQARLAAAKSAGDAPPAADTLSGPLLTEEGMRAEWGETDSDYDLDGDGKVGILDWLKLLTEGGVMENPNKDAELTIDGLQAAWGATNSVYDLDGNGTVGIEDFLALLARSHSAAPGPAAAPDAAPDAAGANTPSGPLLTAEGMKAEWGKTDSDYDLDGDGKVGILDWLKLLGEGGVMENPNKDAALTLDGLQAAWGATNSVYDLDGNGTVGMEDFLALLARSHSAAPDPAAAPDVASPPDAAAALDVAAPSDAAAIAPAPAPDPVAIAAAPTKPEPPLATAKPATVDRNPATLRSIARALFSKLSAAGFAERPPMQIHSLLDTLDFSRTERKTLLEHLSENYPRGLGVNEVG